MGRLGGLGAVNQPAAIRIGASPRPEGGDRSRLAAIVIVGLVVAAALAAVFSAASGATGFMPGRIVPAILDGFGIPASMPARDLMVIQDIRLPRAVLGFMIGAALATAGCVMQGLFRNPLADAGIVGTSSGAALAAVIVIVLGAPFVAMLPDWPASLCAAGSRLPRRAARDRVALRHRNARGQHVDRNDAARRHRHRGARPLPEPAS